MLQYYRNLAHLPILKQIYYDNNFIMLPLNIVWTNQISEHSLDQSNYECLFHDLSSFVLPLHRHLLQEAKLC